MELGFDEAAGRILRAHRHDGEHRDLPIADIKTGGVVPSDGQRSASTSCAGTVRADVGSPFKVTAV